MIAEARNRTLTLVRHAKSSWRYDLDDHARPLNKRGLRDCQRVPPALVGRIEQPELVLSSDAARAVQTCQVLADALEIDAASTRFDGRLYGADVPRLLAIVGEVEAGVDHLMLIGHNPGLTDLLNHLCSDRVDNLPTLGVAVIDVGTLAWSALREDGASIRDLIVPKTI